MAISSELEGLLSAWLPRQSWFPKLETELGADPDITPMSVTRLFEWDTGEGTVRGTQAIISVGDGRTLRRINVPLSFRTSENFALRAHLIGTIDDITLGPCWVYDGCADPVFVINCAHAAATARRFEGGQVAAHAVSNAMTKFHRVQTEHQMLDYAASVRLQLLEARAHESTVVIEDPENPCVLTFFRVVQPGLSQAVRIPVALTEAESRAVPEVMGWVSGRWFDAEELETRSAPLAMLSVQYPDSQPAWREAVDIACAVDSGSIGSYNKKASALGSRIGELHLDLAAEFGVVRGAGEPTEDWIAKWQERVDWALARAPLALGDLQAKLKEHRAHLGRLETVGALQRIHGELTLNQVLTSPVVGFTVVNFSAATQEFPKPAAIDLVALLRSIDYAAGYARLRRTGALKSDAQPTFIGLSGLSDGHESLREVVDSPEYLWSSQAQNSLLTGYSHAVGASVGLHDPVLRAVLIDRLLVEVVTELRNRPTWLIVPLATLTLLLGGRLEHDSQPADDADGEAGAGGAADAAGGTGGTAGADGTTGAATAWNAEETVSAEEFAQSAVEEIAQPADPVPDAYDGLDTEVARAEKNGRGPGAADQTAAAELAAEQDAAPQPEAPARPAAPPAAPEQTPDPAPAQPESDASEATASGTGAASGGATSGTDANADPDDAVIDEDADAEAAAATQFPPIPARPTTLPRFPNRD
ncbi:maltokinase N-terminal cap-like domain-containing protein [Brevibacterium luteolum]|uniref:maltokinase N-terminal cap-like domain-containing protein n=1 Tax=Brevibacterium luteolum TaxID=199591 RepID=UPI003B66F727